MVRCARVGSSATDYLTRWDAAMIYIGDRHEHWRAKGPNATVNEEGAEGAANLSLAK